MILASASPRRKELLERAGFELSIEPADVDETRLPQEAPVHLVERLSRLKAQAALDAHGPLQPDEILLAADTIVWTGDDVLGKPHDAQDAIRMLRELSGRTHHVSTGVCLVRVLPDCATATESFVETTDVSFRALTDYEIMAYVATGEPMDKAGAYAIQGGAGSFVRDIVGDYDNVVGLPVKRIKDLIDASGA